MKTAPNGLIGPCSIKGSRSGCSIPPGRGFAAVASAFWTNREILGPVSGRQYCEAVVNFVWPPPRMVSVMASSDPELSSIRRPAAPNARSG
jgi:hypothetical protein